MSKFVQLTMNGIELFLPNEPHARIVLKEKEGRYWMRTPLGERIRSVMGSPVLMRQRNASGLILVYHRDLIWEKSDGQVESLNRVH